MTTRRGFLGALLTAAAAPAIVRAGSLMPIYVPAQRIVTPLLFNGGLMWQDAAMTLPVTAVGQPVGAVERIGLFDGVWRRGFQQASASRPTAGVAEDGRVFLEFDPTDDYMMTEFLHAGRRKLMP